MPGDPSKYCLAEVARFDPLSPTKLKSLTDMQTKFKDGLEFIISKVALNNDIKQEYVSTPVKATILLVKKKRNATRSFKRVVLHSLRHSSRALIAFS